MWDKVRHFLHPYYVLNGGLFGTYFAWRWATGGPGETLAAESWGFSRERQILAFLSTLMITRMRRRVSAGPLIALYLTLCQVAGGVLFFLDSLWAFAAYVLGVLVVRALFPQPLYKGPTRAVRYSSVALEDEALAPGSRAHLVCFYASWHSASVDFSIVFDDLSLAYAHSGVVFARVDLGRYPKVGERLGVSTQPRKKELPVMALFEDGEETARESECHTKTSEELASWFGLRKKEKASDKNAPVLASKKSKKKQQ